MVFVHYFQHIPSNTAVISHVQAIGYLLLECRVLFPGPKELQKGKGEMDVFRYSQKAPSSHTRVYTRGRWPLESPTDRDALPEEPTEWWEGGNRPPPLKREKVGLIHGQWLHQPCLCNDASMKTLKDGVWWASGLVDTWRCWESSELKEGLEAPSHIPCPRHHFHLAVPEFFPFVRSQ